VNLDDAPRFLTYAELDRELARLHYRRPGWSVALFLDPWEGPALLLTATVVDAYHPERTTDLRIRSLVPPCPTADAFADWVLWRLLQVESHETRELLWRDGAPLYDPHDPVEPAPFTSVSTPGSGAHVAHVPGGVPHDPREPIDPVDPVVPHLGA
jgi:hypothetical protein